MTPEYDAQVRLLLKAIPFVATEDVFALHGGTAINLFHREMPRLSVDIDLTFLPLKGREESLTEISNALARIEERVKSDLTGVGSRLDTARSKLILQSAEGIVKVEVNQTMRGVLDACPELELIHTAQAHFDTWCQMKTVPESQLFGGKICAALDRQHPRDLFDVKYILDQDLNELKQGILFCLLSSARPLSELLNPHLLDQRHVFESQFAGMTNQSFQYEAFEEVRLTLIDRIHSILTDRDKHFLIQFIRGEPDWETYDFERFPAVQWKLSNLRSLIAKNPSKHEALVEKLISIS